MRMMQYTSNQFGGHLKTPLPSDRPDGHKLDGVCTMQTSDALWMSMLLSAFAGVLAVTVVIATFYFIRQAAIIICPKPSNHNSHLQAALCHTPASRVRRCTVKGRLAGILRAKLPSPESIYLQIRHRICLPYTAGIFDQSLSADSLHNPGECNPMNSDWPLLSRQMHVMREFLSMQSTSPHSQPAWTAGVPADGRRRGGHVPRRAQGPPCGHPREACPHKDRGWAFPPTTCIRFQYPDGSGGRHTHLWSSTRSASTLAQVPMVDLFP